MRIGEIAELAGVPAKTLRFWEEQGLVPRPPRTISGYRDYEPSVVERLAFIRHAQAAGLSLNQIRQILDVADAGDPPCAHVGDVVASRLAEVEARIAELQATRAHLRRLRDRAATQDPSHCQGFCTIITPPDPSNSPPTRSSSLR